MRSLRAPNRKRLEVITPKNAPSLAPCKVGVLEGRASVTLARRASAEGESRHETNQDKVNAGSYQRRSGISAFAFLWLNVEEGTVHLAYNAPRGTSLICAL